MIRDITIGQYYPADSPLHKLDPRTKLMGTLVFIISVFLFNTHSGVCSGNSISGCCNKNIKGSCKIYF